MKILLKLYSFLQSKWGFKSFGEDSIIKFPFKIWGKRHISIGNKSFISENSFLSAVEEWNNEKFQPTLKIGNNVTIGSNFFATCIGKITIEDNVLISERVFISDHIHGYEDIEKPISEQKLMFKGEVLIKKGSFIGINSVIMPGVTVGKNSIIGASSVVTKSVSNYTVVAGNPAKEIKRFDLKTKKWINAK